MLVVVRPFLSTLSPRSDLFTCTRGLNDRSVLTVSSPSLAVDQKADVRQAKTATSSGAWSESLRRSPSMYATVIGSLLALVKDVGAMALAPLIIAFTSGLLMFQGIPWTMCHARTAAT